MKSYKCISLQLVKQHLRKDHRCSVINASGYCIFMDTKGGMHYILDDNGEPVTFSSFNTLIKQPLKNIRYTYQYP